MKTLIPRFFIPGVAMATLILGSGCSQSSDAQISNAQTQVPPPPVAATNSTAMAPENPEPPAPVAQKDATPPAAAALPSDVSPTSPLAQVIRLTQASVDQSIIMTFVTNSSRLFNLDSDKIIYLSDLGAPTELVTAMMQRDQQLQNQFNADQATQLAQQTPAAQPAPSAETPPANTTEVAAQPDTQAAPVTINYFNDTLQPYGNWVVVSGYGRCWRPTAVAYDPTWQPYCNRGNWVYTDCGWYWNSDYAWGATFHYGRWFRDAGVGWCWYPGTVWAPSWVTWRYSNNYCGWAPLPPRTTYQAGVGIVYNGGGVSVGFGFGLGANCYTFVPAQHFCDPHPRNYCVAPAQVTQIYNNTTVINNFNVNHHTVVNNGIAVGNIATATHSTIHAVPVHEIHPGIAQGNHGQPFNHFGQVPGANHPNSSGAPSAPLRNEVVAQNRLPRNHDWHEVSAAPSQFNGVPNQTPTQHNPVAATIPQRPLPSSQNPSVGFRQPTVPETGRQADAPRTFTPGANGLQNLNAAAQNRSVQPPANNYASQNRNQMFASIPQRQAPTMNYPSPTPTRAAQTPPASFYQQPFSATGQQTGAPRNYTYQPNGSQNNIGTAQNLNTQPPANYYASPRNNNQQGNYAQQNYRSAPAQSSAPAHAPVSSQGGNQGGNRGWSGH